MRGFHTAYPSQEFSCKKVNWFPGCVGKKNLDFVQLVGRHLELATSALNLDNMNWFPHNKQLEKLENVLVFKNQTHNLLCNCILSTLSTYTMLYFWIWSNSCAWQYIRSNKSKLYIWRVYFQKGLNPLFLVLRKSPFFRITILHFINSDNFVVNERCHMKKPKTHNSFTLRFLYTFLCISLFSTICGFRPFWKKLKGPILGKLIS